MYIKGGESDYIKEKQEGTKITSSSSNKSTILVKSRTNFNCKWTNYRRKI